MVMHRIAVSSVVLSFIYLKVVEALAIVYPNAATIYDQSGASRNLIQWSLYPLTSPAPATDFFDIYIRNGVGSMYAGVLNISIAQNVNMMNPDMFYPFSDASVYVPGPGYQLFFSAPGDANTVYCDSAVFSIGAMMFNASSTTFTGPYLAPTSTTSGSLPISGSSASPDASASQSDTTLLTTPVMTTSDIASPTPITTSSSSSPETISTNSDEVTATTTIIQTSVITSIVSATVEPSSTSRPSGDLNSNEGDLGGPAGQGFNLLDSPASALRVGAGVVAGVVACSMMLLL